MGAAIFEVIVINEMTAFATKVEMEVISVPVKINVLMLMWCHGWRRHR